MGLCEGFFLAVSSRKVQTAYLTESKVLNYIGTCGKAKFTGGNFENKLKQFFISKINPAAKGHSLTGSFWRKRTNGFLAGNKKNTSRWYLHKNKKHHASELGTSDRRSECCCSLPDRSVGLTPNPPMSLSSIFQRYRCRCQCHRRFLFCQLFKPPVPVLVTVKNSFAGASTCFVILKPRIG